VVNPAAHGDGSAQAVANGRIARQRRLDRFEAWAQELREHRETHRQSRFRWWDKDVMSIATWTTWGRVDFTDLKHLRALEKWRVELYMYACACETGGMAEPLLEAQALLYGPGVHWDLIAEAVNMTQLECRIVVGRYGYTRPAEREPNKQVQRIRRMAYSNPLIRVWETKQLVAMHLAAVDVLEDTLIDLVEELRPTHRLSDILRAAGNANEDRLADRIATQRTARGGPNDPRRVPRQTFT